MLLINRTLLGLLLIALLPSCGRVRGVRDERIRAREAILRDDLVILRSCIDQYTLDKQKAPESLEDLVTAGYLKQIPEDPFTHSQKTWQLIRDESLQDKPRPVQMDPVPIHPGISDVRSGSKTVGLDGTRYSSW